MNGLVENKFHCDLLLYRTSTILENFKTSKTVAKNLKLFLYCTPLRGTLKAPGKTVLLSEYLSSAKFFVIGTWAKKVKISQLSQFIEPSFSYDTNNQRPVLSCD